MRKISELVLTFGYVGHIPVASGTWGSAAVLPFLWLIPAHWNFAATVAITATVLFALGSWLARDALSIFGSEDPSPVVLDEVVGMLLAVALVPRPTLPWIIAAFFLFRLFDIWKPFPVRQGERVGGGLGIFLDDVLAGLYANGLLHLAALILGR